MCSLFTPISPPHCIICRSPLKPHKYYDRFAISSYGIIRCPITYWICSNPDCKKHHHNKLIGVTGSANYGDEYIEKMKCARYDGRCTLWNSRITGEIFTEGLTDTSGRAPCPTTLWKYEQIRGRISAEELISQDIDFNGVLHIDGHWVKTGWRNYIEAQLGKELTNREWMRELQEEIPEASINGGGYLLLRSIKFIGGLGTKVLAKLAGKIERAEVDMGNFRPP